MSKPVVMHTIKNGWYRFHVVRRVAFADAMSFAVHPLNRRRDSTDPYLDTWEIRLAVLDTVMELIAHHYGLPTVIEDAASVAA